MRIAIYGRVSTGHQVEHQTIEQQIERLTAHVAGHATEGWTLDPAHLSGEVAYRGEEHAAAAQLAGPAHGHADGDRPAALGPGLQASPAVGDDTVASSDRGAGGGNPAGDVPCA